MTTEYKKTRRSHYEAVKKMNNLQKNRREKENQTFGRLGRRFGSRASQAPSLRTPYHDRGGGPAAEFAHRPNDSSTSLCVCVQAGPARHVAKPCVRARTHRHTAVHNKTMCSGGGRARLSHRYQTPPPSYHTTTTDNNNTTIYYNNPRKSHSRQHTHAPTHPLFSPKVIPFEFYVIFTTLVADALPLIQQCLCSR